MPTPMMPHVPTSMRFLGLYMSTIERVKSSAFAPSLTSIASGFALTMSRTTASALWKFIGVGFVGGGQHEGARGGGALLVRIRQQALGHRHGQIGDAGFLDERADVGVGLRVRRAFAENDQRLFRAAQQIECALHRLGRRDLLRGR